MSRFKRSLLPPIDAQFPCSSPFPIINSVLDEVERNVQSPRPLIVFSLLTAVSVSVQGLFDVRKPNDQRVPISLLLLTIAESGERKSASENIFLDPIGAFQRKQEDIWKEQVSEWRVRDKIWLIKSKETMRKIASLSSKQKCTEEVEIELIKHDKARPAKPRQFKMLYDDSTSEALFLGLYENLPTAGIISSEGGLKGRAFNDTPKQNAMWSGDPIVVDRKTAESYVLYGARLTFSAMTQPSAFKSYMETRGENARGSGLWARFLVCYPESTQGSRVLNNTTVSWEHVNRYAERMEQLLICNLDLLGNPCKKREVIGFSPAAGKLWMEIYNEIESGIPEGGRFYAAGDLASKLADNIARVAALLHIFEGGGGDITLHALEFSIDFCLWCSDEFFRLFIPPREIDVDVLQLREWFDTKFDAGYRKIRRNEIMQFGPRRIRNKKRLDACLNEMISQGVISCFESGGSSFVRF